MSPRGCHVLVLVVVAALAPACRAPPPCSPPPQGCSHSPDIPGHAPMAVDLCVAGQAPAVLTLQGPNIAAGTLIVRVTPGGVTLDARLGGERVTRRVAAAALGGGRLRLNIHYDDGARPKVLAWSSETLVNMPVSGTDSLRAALTHRHQLSHDAAVCLSQTTPPPRRPTPCHTLLTRDPQLPTPCPPCPCPPLAHCSHTHLARPYPFPSTLQHPAHPYIMPIAPEHTLPIAPEHTLPIALNTATQHMVALPSHCQHFWPWF